MTGADLTLEVETTRVAVGDEVTGRVRVGSAGASADTSFSVELLWRTSGQCQSEEKIVATQPVSPAGPGGAPFRLRIPQGGPMTYVGRTFAIDWCVRIPGDPPVEEPITVVAAVQSPQMP